MAASSKEEVTLVVQQIEKLLDTVRTIVRNNDMEFHGSLVFRPDPSKETRNAVHVGYLNTDTMVQIATKLFENAARGGPPPGVTNRADSGEEYRPDEVGPDITKL